MSRMKTFLIYLIAFVAFYIFTDVMISIALANNYENIKCTTNEPTGYVINLTEAKATSVSGYVKGTIKLIEGTENPDKYLQLDLYSKYGNCIGRRFADLSNLQPGQEKEFKMNFEYDNIESYQITTTNNVQKLSEVQTDLVSKGYLAVTVLGILIVLYYVW